MILFSRMDTVGGDSIGATGIDSEEYFAHACGYVQTGWHREKSRYLLPHVR